MSASIFKSEFYFDSAAVQAQVRALAMNPEHFNRAGALVRTIARGSIRRVQAYTKKGRKKTSNYSKAGQAPRSRDRRGRYKLIEYQWSPQHQGMIVGHVGLPRSRGEPASHVHEFGESQQVVRLVLPPKSGRKYKSKASERRQKRAFAKLMSTYGPFQDAARNRKINSPHASRRQFRWESVRYPKRPTMHPALAKARDKLPQIFADSLDRSQGGVTALANTLNRIHVGG